MSPQPLLLELDGSSTSTTSSVREQLKWFTWAEKAVSYPTSIVLKYIYFDSAIQRAALNLIGSHHDAIREEEEDSSSTPSSSSRFQSLTLWDCLENDESPLLEQFVMEAIRLDIFRSITLKDFTSCRNVWYVPMKVFDVQRGGFPPRLDRLVLHSMMLTDEDFGFLAGAMGNNYDGNGNAERRECGLRHLTIQKVGTIAAPTIRNFDMARNFRPEALAFLCDGFRRNKSLRTVEVLHFEMDFPWLTVLECLSENTQLTSVHLAIHGLEAWAKGMESCPNLPFAKNLQTLHLSVWHEMDYGFVSHTRKKWFMSSLSANATAAALHVLRLMTLHPRLSHVWIDRFPFRGGTRYELSDTTVTDVPYVCDSIPPELDHQIRHMADLNYAGRSLIMQEVGKTDAEGTGGMARTGTVPKGLWPLVLERALQKPWPFSTDPSQLDTVGWVPTNRFNGIYYLLRFGPALLH